MTHQELMKLEEAGGTQVVTIEETDGQFKMVSIKEIIDKLKHTGVWVKTPGYIPKCPFCGAYSEDANTGTFFAEDDPRNGEPIHYCSNCGAYLTEERC